MAGVGESAAIITLITTAAQLSSAIYDVASRYNDAKDQIQAFGNDLKIFEKILVQLSLLLCKIDSRPDLPGNMFQIVTTMVIEDSANMLLQLEAYIDSLYNRVSLDGTPRGFFLGQGKCAFDAKEFMLHRTRLDGMKLNILFVLIMNTSGSRGSR